MGVNFKYFLGEAASSIRRNFALSVAAMMITILALSMLGVVMMIVHAGNSLAVDLKYRVDEIRVFLEDNITVEERESLERFVRDMKEVRKVTFISKEQALEDFKEMYKDKPQIIEEIEGNPLPAELKIRMRDPKYNSDVSERLEKRPEVSVDPDTGKKEIQFPKDVVAKVLRWTGAIQKIGLVIVLALALVALALISITIRMAIYSRRKEIGIMKLVGATNWFIRWPFIMEGMLEGALGGTIAVLVVLLTHAWGITKFEAAAEANLVGGSYLGLLSFFLILIGIVIGALGSAVALRRFMEV